MKRLFDLLVVVVCTPLWVPILALTALMVRIKLGAPVFFRQKRPGRGAVVFEMVKFRTMTDARDASGQLLPDAVRLTPFGKFLRATSLDELPELWNVLRGDMSLVGPRPLLVHYLERYSLRQARRHEVRPGITGLAQVKGRNALSWEEKFEWDVRYVETQSLWLDLTILFLTVKTVFFRTGISAAGDATMPEFRGTGGGGRGRKSGTEGESGKWKRRERGAKVGEDAKIGVTVRDIRELLVVIWSSLFPACHVPHDTCCSVVGCGLVYDFLGGAATTVGDGCPKLRR